MSAARQIRLERVDDPAVMAELVAQRLLTRARATAGRFSLNLSGGSTPQALYRRLSEPPFREAFPWARTHLFFGDERFVPANHPRSNYRMVREALIEKVQLPAENVHRIPTDMQNPAAAAEVYARTLQMFYGGTVLDPKAPLFDTTLLGLGEDGHTASLFPDAPELEETSLWVVPVGAGASEPRVTLTYPALNSSRDVLFLVAGGGKRAMLQRLLAGDRALPAARIDPVGALGVVCDAAAEAPP